MSTDSVPKAMALTGAEKQRRYRARLRARGLVEIHLTVTPEQRDAINQLLADWGGHKLPEKPAPVDARPKLKADGEGAWQVFLNGERIGRLSKRIADGYPKRHTLWRAYRKTSMLATEHRTRRAALAALMREADTTT